MGFFCLLGFLSPPPPPPTPHDFNTAHDTANKITRIMHSSFPTSRFNDMMWRHYEVLLNFLACPKQKNQIFLETDQVVKRFE